MKNIEMRQSGQVSVCRCLVLNYSDLSVLAPTRFKRFLDQKKRVQRICLDSPTQIPFSMHATPTYLHCLQFLNFFFFKEKKIKHKWPKRVGFHLKKGKYFLLNLLLNNLLPERTY